MQVRYERDNARRGVTVTLRGGYEASEILALLERHRIEDDWSAALGQSALRIELSRDTDEAAEWLTAQTDAGGDVTP